MRSNELVNFSSKNENDLRKRLEDLIYSKVIDENQLLSNLGLFLDTKNLSRFFFMKEIYEIALQTHGIICEFGTHWGQNLSTFMSLRELYEPFNRHRKIIGFDTFEGFEDIHKEDGKSSLMQKGNLALPKDYHLILDEILSVHESLGPLNHIKKFEIIKGDASKTLKKYIKDNSQTIFSLVYFDLDVYKPTFDCLKLIKDRLVKGSVVAFDELCDEDSPGETVALMEVFGLNNIRLKRPKNISRVSYFIYE